MIRNYIFTVIRQIRKNKTFSFVNITGLGVGMAACLLIAQYVYFHLDFDKYHEKGSNIFRIEAETTKDGKDIGTSITFGPLLPQKLEEQSPHVTAFTRFWNINYANHSLIRKSDKGILTFEERGVYITDKYTFDVFDLPLKAGSTDNFDQPLKMVLTNSSALRFFNNAEEAIGQTIELSGNQGAMEFEVIAVLEDLPKNTHLSFNTLLSFPTTRKYFGEKITMTSGNTLDYLVLDDASKAKEVTESTQQLFEKEAGETLRSYGYTFDFALKQLSEIHLFDKSSHSSEFKAGVKATTIYAMGIIAIVILVIAWINYLNLAFVKVFERSKEVGVRRVMGSGGRQISMLFVMEAIALNVISFILALTITQIASPIMKRMTGFEFSLLQYPMVTLLLFLLVVVGSLLTGFYPSIMVKALKTSDLLTGKSTSPRGGNRSRQFLVSFQFAITFLLVAGTTTIYKQISYMKNAELGIDIDQVMVLKAPPGEIQSDNQEYVQNFNALKNNLLNNTVIKDVISAGETPGEVIGWGASIWLETATQEQSVGTSLISMGRGFPEFFNINLVAGRMFQDGDDPWTRGDVIINEKMAESLGFTNPEDVIGKKLKGFFGGPLIVRGVLENHHHTSLHHDFDPIAYILSSWQEFYFVKFNIDNSLDPSERSNQLKAGIQLVKNEWGQVFTNNPLDYYFLDQSFDQQYDADEKFGKVFTAFSLLAILIACLGLYGLTSFMLQKRTKEIGIRKVLGAGRNDLIVLLSRNYVILILLSFVVSMPVAWKVLSEWLTNYTFSIEIGWWFVYLPLIIVLLIAIITISIRVLKVAGGNPVDSLRYE